jgi:hypothetical protein
MECESCHQIIAEILRLLKKLDACGCTEYEEETDDEKTCEPCLYFSINTPDYCWERHIHRNRSDRRCRKFVDYEEWFKIHGIKST